MVCIKTYTFNHFYEQYLVLLTMVPRNINMYLVHNCLFFFPEHFYFPPAGEGRFSRSQLRRTQGLPVSITAGLRGPCFGRSKSRNVASNRGDVCRPAK